MSDFTIVTWPDQDVLDHTRSVPIWTFLIGPGPVGKRARVLRDFFTQSTDPLTSKHTSKK